MAKSQQSVEVDAQSKRTGALTNVDRHVMMLEFNEHRKVWYLTHWSLLVISTTFSCIHRLNCLATHLHPDPLIKPKCLFNAQDAFIHLIREMMRHSFALGVMNSTLTGLFKQVLLQFIHAFVRGACALHRGMQNSQRLPAMSRIKFEKMTDDCFRNPTKCRSAPVRIRKSIVPKPCLYVSATYIFVRSNR